jgi:transketolase
LEEHSLIGGLGSIISQILSEKSVRPLHKAFGLPDAFPDKYGRQEELLSHYGLDVEELYGKIEQVFLSME